MSIPMALYNAGTMMNPTPAKLASHRNIPPITRGGPQGTTHLQGQAKDEDHHVQTERQTANECQKDAMHVMHDIRPACMVRIAPSCKRLPSMLLFILVIQPTAPS